MITRFNFLACIKADSVNNPAGRPERSQGFRLQTVSMA